MKVTKYDSVEVGWLERGNGMGKIPISLETMINLTCPNFALLFYNGLKIDRIVLGLVCEVIDYSA